MGPSCECTRLKCFESTTHQERQTLLDFFNALPTIMFLRQENNLLRKQSHPASMLMLYDCIPTQPQEKKACKNQQDSLLASMVATENIKNRRPRLPQEQANMRDRAFKYSFNVSTNGETSTVPVCLKALMAVFGVTKSRIENVKESIVKSGLPPLDQRGKHNIQPFKFPAEQVDRIMTHIQSFKERSSHYALGQNRRLYLSEELNVQKMFDLYREKYPDDKCSYESYRKIFNEKFNISFGYPRKDTCSACDEFEVKLKACKSEESEDHNRLMTEKELHLRRADTFYKRKAAARRNARSVETSAAIAFDYQKNLQCPNIATNDVYYRRQLAFHSFNVHNLASNDAFFYCYDETVAKKGADDVASMLHHFFFQHLPMTVTHVELFCDSCAGQNKNWTVFRYLHALVHKEERLCSIKITFPMRGHSYLECDRDMVCVNQKARVETPDQWFWRQQGVIRLRSPL